jgi:ubiquinone/menaquinone biosynthesis C-methylase UbiE
MNNTYWDNVYLEKSEEDMSWFQEHPVKSLEMIKELGLSKSGSIIDIGGGDSRLVDHLLTEGFEDLSVLDISEVSLKKLKNRLLGAGNKVAYLVSDVTEFRPPKLYDLWHDRATFHFLTSIDQINKYLETANAALKPGGNLIISTFSKDGPEKCSGLPIHKYSESELKELFQHYFTNTRCFEDTHVTPWGKTQSFVYCGFKKKV